MDSNIKTYLALGDSYTIGESVDQKESFPFQTVNILESNGISLNTPDVIAITGWTTGDLLGAINEKKPSTNYSIVSLLIGVNNQYQEKSIEEYSTEFRILLNEAIRYAKSIKENVFVLSIPDYGVTPFAIDRDPDKIAIEIDEFNEVNKSISAELGVKYLDITSISRLGKNDLSFQASDGLHPSGKQYQMWARLLAPMVKARFLRD
jgi:lysophospholipase L1-like esterase